MNAMSAGRSILRRSHGGFTLVELLLVASIMVIMMGLLAYSLSESQGRSVQVAASQVASGLGVARQAAITRNTDALFIVASRSGAQITDFYPQEAFRYWAVVQSNRGQNTWSFVTDWTALPAGAVFIGLAGESYQTLEWKNIAGTPPVPGTPFEPRVAASSQGEWRFFNNFTNNLRMVWPGGSTNLANVPFVGFRPRGEAFFHRMSGPGAVPQRGAIVVGEGSALPGNQIVTRSSNNITHVETDAIAGRIIVRPRESFR